MSRGIERAPSQATAERPIVRRRWKFLRVYDTRHGQTLIEVRRRGFKNIRLPEHPEKSPEALAAYFAALGGKAPEPIVIAAHRSKEGSLNEAVQAFYLAPNFTELAEATQRDQRRELRRFCQEGGDVEQKRAPRGERPLSHYTTPVVYETIMARTSEASRRQLLRALQNFFRFCVTSGKLENNPAETIKGPKRKKTDGHYTITDEEADQFRARWPIGTQERLAFCFMVHGASRIGDSMNFRPSHIRKGILKWTPHKTKNKTGVEVTIELALCPELVEALEKTPRSPTQGVNGTFLYAKRGAPWCESKASEFMRKAFDAAGLPHCSSHGLRKNNAVRMSHAGATQEQIMAQLGQVDIRDSAIYTAKANRERNAREAQRKLFKAAAAPADNVIELKSVG